MPATFVITAADVVYWGNLARLQQQVAELLGIPADQVEILVQGENHTIENDVPVWDTQACAFTFVTEGSPE